ncbi:regulator of G-protein signaling 20-like isoform X1 [Lethenteron reissneri]|uniref:regulator of G-protein signaling 20-like isoform X1 n=1 Tax=Lethenteron reissneri TaxID=7753 RepID=UPI002AB7A2E6|nr:regulator of G-protein signaling 20-like isoform X1 [Lethenteron reissneri]XP_061405347.1 regulator of G-protein signaling 20-like isoform X1 [Lethenteron reissneri]
MRKRQSSVGGLTAATSTTTTTATATTTTTTATTTTGTREGSPDTRATTRGSRTVHRGAPQQGATNTCCFCWCCCCSCSCLAIRNREEEDVGRRTSRDTKLESIPSPGESAPSPEEVRAWGRSFDRLMRSAAGRRVFREFLRSEFSEENLLFWLSCEELTHESDPAAIEERARNIYEDYISILSPKEVSLDSRVREVINRNMLEPTPHTFDDAQLQIYTLMHRDSYPRFINSVLYKSLLNSTRASSTAGSSLSEP